MYLYFKDIKKFAEISGDRNPVHLEEVFAENSDTEVIAIGRKALEFAKRQGNAAVYSDLTKQMTSSGLGEDSWWVKNACIQGLANVQAYYLAEINKIESSKESTLDQMEELSKLRAREAELTNTINEITILQDQSGPSSMLNR